MKLINTLINKNQSIIFISSESCYGQSRGDGFYGEESELNPISLYAELKVEAEKIILDSGNNLILRFATAFGLSPRMRLDLLINDFTYRAVNDHFIVIYEGGYKRNFVHIKDIARSFIHCIDNFSKMKNNIFNVGLDYSLSKLEICTEIKKQVSDFYFVEAAIGSDVDKRDYKIDVSKIAVTGFTPKISLETGINELIKGYQIIKRNQFSNV